YPPTHPLRARRASVQRLSPPLLPQMSWHRASHLADCPGAGGPRDALCPCDLYPAARPGAPGAPESAPALWAALSHRRPDAPGHCPGPKTSRGRDRWLRCLAHLGPATASSSPSALCPARGGPGARWDPVAAMSPPLLPARPRPLAALSAPVPGGAGAALRARPPDLDGSLSRTRRAPALATVPRHAARPGVGGLRGRAPPGPPACLEVPGPLYASCGHFQPSSRGLGGRPSDLPL